MQIISSFFVVVVVGSRFGDGEGPVTDDLIGADKKIPDQLVKIAFLREAETAIRSA